MKVEASESGSIQQAGVAEDVSTSNATSSPSPPSNTNLKFTGSIARVIHKKSESSWGICLISIGDIASFTEVNRLKPRPKKPQRFADNTSQLRQVKGVGIFPTFALGATIEVEGKWEDKGTFGVQFLILSARLPAAVFGSGSTREGMIDFLAYNFSNVGPMKAREIVDAFKGDGLALAEDLNNGGELLASRIRIAPDKLQELVTEWKIFGDHARIASFLHSIGFGPSLVTRIRSSYAKQNLNDEMIEEAIRANPYRLIDDIYGIGFRLADDAALKIGFPPESQKRRLAALQFVLEEASRDGHTWISEADAMTHLSKLIGQPMPKRDDTYGWKFVRFDSGVKAGRDEDRIAIALKKLYEAELTIARTVRSKVRERLSEVEAESIKQWQRENEPSDDTLPHIIEGEAEKIEEGMK